IGMEGIESARPASAPTIRTARAMGNTGAHLDPTTRNSLPLPARNEWAEGRSVLRGPSSAVALLRRADSTATEDGGEGHFIKSASSPRPSPPLREERERPSSGRVVVVSKCAWNTGRWVNQLVILLDSNHGSLDHSLTCYLRILPKSPSLGSISIRLPSPTTPVWALDF